jgi:hypothetical protein
MLSKETLEEYRHMTPSERLALTIQLMEGIDLSLLSGTEQQVDRKFELMRRENDLRNRNMLTAIAKSRVWHGSPNRD